MYVSIATPDGVPTLIGGNFRIDSLLVPETRLSSAEHLEIDPSEPDLLKLALNVPPQKIVTRQIRAAFGRKHQCIRSCISRDLAPRIKIQSEVRWQRSLALPPLSLRVIEKSSVDALSDFDHLRINSAPTQSEDLAGSHPDQYCEQVNHPFPQIQDGQCLPNLFFGHGAFRSRLRFFWRNERICRVALDDRVLGRHLEDSVQIPPEVADYPLNRPFGQNPIRVGWIREASDTFREPDFSAEVDDFLRNADQSSTSIVPQTSRNFGPEHAIASGMIPANCKNIWAVSILVSGFVFARPAQAQTPIPFTLAPQGCSMAHCTMNLSGSTNVVPPVSSDTSVVTKKLTPGASLGLGCSSNYTIVACTYQSITPSLIVFDGDGNRIFDSGKIFDSAAWTSAPIVSSAGEVIACDDQSLVRFAANGSVVWQTPIVGSGNPISPVLTKNGVVLVATSDGEISSYSVQTGGLLGTFPVKLDGLITERKIRPV